MRGPFPLAVLMFSVLSFGGCPADNGEGEGDAAEGEGEGDVGEGEGDVGEGEGDVGEGEGDVGEGEGEGEGEGLQGMFMTLNGVPLKATGPASPDGSFVFDSSFADGGGARVHFVANEDGGDEPWDLQVPKAEGSYTCADNVNNDPAQTAVIAMPVGPGGRSAANSNLSHDEDCFLIVDRLDPTGIISGTFGGVLGGTAGAPQTVALGRFFFDNSRGGGDCSRANDPGLGVDETGATFSVTRLDPINSAVPKYLRCGDTAKLAVTSSFHRDPEGFNPGGQFISVSNDAVYLDGHVGVGLQFDAIDGDVGGAATCANLRFVDYTVSGAFVDPDHCAVVLTRNDATFIEGTYEATLSVTRPDGRAEIDVAGTFRAPPVFPAP